MKMSFQLPEDALLTTQLAIKWLRSKQDLSVQKPPSILDDLNKKVYFLV